MNLTDVDVDDNLIDQAVELGKHKTKEEAATAALEYYIQLKKRATAAAPEGKHRDNKSGGQFNAK
jgi:hypothetical protein